MDNFQVTFVFSQENFNICLIFREIEELIRYHVLFYLSYFLIFLLWFSHCDVLQNVKHIWQFYSFGWTIILIFLLIQLESVEREFCAFFRGVLLFNFTAFMVSYLKYICNLGWSVLDLADYFLNLVFHQIYV